MKALFFINSLSNGGAERVCSNLANEMVKEGYKIDFIILGENEDNVKTYYMNKKIKIYNLNINGKNKIKKTIKLLLSIHKVNNIIKENEKKERYDVITSHLPMSNLITRLSKVKNRAIYVFHIPLKAYNKYKCKFIFKLIIKFMFGNRKIATVSEGVREEAINEYKFNEKLVRTIYNPINVDEIENLKKEPINIKDKYFLHVGRFNLLKRQDRMLEIFFKGEFYKDYKLIFCGQGQLEQEIKNKVKELKIEDRVIFIEWQPNIYKWMYNSEILINTSDFESFSMVILEAMVCGTKVVASDCDFGPREIMKESYNKYLVETDNIDEYIKKINMALKEYPKEKNIFIEKCLPNNIVSQYFDFMKE